MTNKQANSIGAATMLLVAIIIIYITSCSSCVLLLELDAFHDMSNINQKDDTEHIWIGGNGDTIIE